MMHLSKAHQDFFDYLTTTYMVDTANKDVYLDYAEYLSQRVFPKRLPWKTKTSSFRQK